MIIIAARRREFEGLAFARRNTEGFLRLAECFRWEDGSFSSLLEKISFLRRGNSSIDR